jgi:predicted nucleic acid-binding protein
VFYLDTSAFLKLLLVEEHSAAMRAWYVADRDCWSSQLLVTEVLRAASRRTLDLTAGDELLDRITLVLPSQATFRRAAELRPPQLRSLDALHLASALELGAELEAVVAYDTRVIDGAVHAGLAVVTPR